MSKLDLIGIEYLQVVEEIYGAYLDATMGFRLGMEQMSKGRTLLKNKQMSQQEFDSKRIFYSSANSLEEHLQSSKTVHRTTQGQFNKRNSKDGKNFQIMGNLCLVQIYQFWEDCYRKRLADEVGIKKDSILHDVFGDIRLLRISIVHHRNIALKDVETRCKKFKWFKENDPIFIQEHHFYEIIHSIKQSLVEIVSELNTKYKQI